jgi:hypothetical protein
MPLTKPGSPIWLIICDNQAKLEQIGACSAVLIDYLPAPDQGKTACQKK